VLGATEDRKTQGRPGQANTFGLLPGLPRNGGTCPGMTEGPRGCQRCEGRKVTWHCYAARLARFRPVIYQQLQRNTELLTKARASGKEGLLLQEFARFAGVESQAKKPWRYYRLHWSGDIFNEEYAVALRAAMARFPEIAFWGYTRSFFAVPILAGLINCQLYLSLDEENWKEGSRVHARFRRAGNIGISAMLKNKPEEGHFVPCPVDAGRMKQEQSCRRCRLCLTGKPVWFYMR